MPILPALAAIAGWMIDRALSSADPPLGRALKYVFVGMLIVGAAAGIAIPVAGRITRGWIESEDIVLALFAIATIAVILVIWKRRDMAPAITSALLASALLVALITAWWVPSLKPYVKTDKQIAADLHTRFPGRPFAYVWRTRIFRWLSFWIVWSTRSPKTGRPATTPRMSS